MKVKILKIKCQLLKREISGRQKSQNSSLCFFAADEGREKADGNLVKSFLIHLTQRDSIVLSPHQTLDIPVIFTPTDHNTHYAECVVSVHQTNTALQPADG